MLNKENFAVIKALKKQLKKQGIYNKDIAVELGVHPKTVSRAVKRNSAPAGKRQRRGSKGHRPQPGRGFSQGEDLSRARRIPTISFSSAGTSGTSSTMYLANYKEGPAGFVDGSWAWLDNGMTVAAANDGTPVPAVLKRTGHLSRMDNRVTTQTNGGYVVVQRSTYALAGQTIAVRVSGDLVEPTNNGLYYMYSDHPSASSGQALGSASAIQKDGSTEVEQARYLPFGDWRTEPDNLPTNRGFTGHVHNNLGGGADDLGLIYMNARFYLPALGRFASADTIVPNPTNPQSLNRYSYVRNSPLNLTDPTGHRECDGSNDCSKPFHEAPSRSSLLPDEKPTGLNQDYGELAWEGLQKIQAMEGGWWGDALSAQEAIMLILNHELGEEMGPNAHHAPLDALINKFNNNCSGGPWSTSCINNFWGYSHVIKESKVALNGGDRFARPGYISWLTETANSFINHSAKPVDPSLTQWGNALNNRSAQLLWQDYQNGVTTYASYVSISGYEVDLVLQVSVIGSVFVVQNDVQWHKTGTLQNWFYPEE